MVGVPVVQGAHAADFSARTLGDDGAPYLSRFLGQARIVDGNGNTLASLSYEDGAAVVVRSITLGKIREMTEAIPDEFWSCDLPEISRKRWETGNAMGQEYYRRSVRPELPPS
jgi:hypothetical protein